MKGHWVVLSVFFWLSLTSTFGQNPKFADSLYQLIQSTAKKDSVYLKNIQSYVVNEADYSKRIALAEEGLELSRALTLPSYEGKMLKYLGDSYNFLGDAPRALKYYLDALRVFQSLAQERRYLASVYNSIGILYLSQKNYDLSKGYLIQALQMHLEVQNYPGAAGDLLNLGEAYRLNHELDSALLLFQQAEVILDSLGYNNFHAYALGNIGLVQVEQNNFREGMTALDSTTQVLTEYGDFYGIASFKIEQGKALIETDSYEEAEQALGVALEVAQENGLKEQIRDASKLLAEVFAKDGKYQRAYYHQNQYIAYNDTLTDEENAQELAEQRADYTIRQERLENELELEALEAESRLRGILAWVMGVGFSSIAILAGFLFVINRRKQLANQLLEEQKERIEQKSEIIDTKNREITASIEYASRIQRAMLPFEDKMKKHFSKHFALLKPRDIVSGDFYWMQEVGEVVLFAVADCTGHGVPGALMSMLGTSVLDELAIGQGIADPGMLLTRLHEEIMRQLKQETSDNQDGMDISVISYHPATKTVCYAGAKLPLVYVQLNEAGKPWLHMIKGDRFFVGGDLNVDKPEFTVHTITLDRPTALYMFSDGYQDQFGGAKNKKFRPANFRDLLLQAFPLDAPGQLALLDRTFEDWKRGQEQLDDVLVVGIKLP